MTRNAPSRCFLRAGLFAAAVICACAVAAPRPGMAQTVVTAVNGEPITSFDIDEEAKLLKLLHKASGRSDALEAVIANRLKYAEARHWGLDASDSDMQATLTRLASELKVDARNLIDSATRARIDIETIRAHLRSAAAWNNYVRARNKTLGVSEEEITARLAKEGGGFKVTDYTLNQIVFVVPVNAAPNVIESRLKEAQGLRNRFSDCNSGFQLARALPEVVVKETMTRASDSFSPAFKKVLAETPSGRLTAPERSASGIEMVAVCAKSDASDPTTLRERVQKDLLTDKLAAESEKMYKALRSVAVISKN